MTKIALLLAAAIGLCRPALPKARVAAYATLIDAEAARLQIDPWIVVALVDHESGWNEKAISKDRKDFGLGQIRARFVAKKSRKRLLDGLFNLKITFAAIEAWRQLCRIKVKTDSTTAFLEGYAGRSRPKAGQWCGISTTTGVPLPPLKSTVWILARAAQLAP